jgi:hypothetical protein
LDFWSFLDLGSPYYSSIACSEAISDAWRVSADMASDCEAPK